MPPITTRGKPDTLRKQLETVADHIPARSLEAIRDFLTAADYGDNALLKASRDSVLGALVGLGREIIREELEATNRAKDRLRKAWREHVDGQPCDNPDEIKEVIETCIDERVAALMRVRDQVAHTLANSGYQLENAPELEEGIRDLRRFREGILRGWPRTDRPPTPLDRQTLEEVRAALARGERGMRKADMIWGRERKTGG